jgi:hypothetical protein
MGQDLGLPAASVAGPDGIAEPGLGALVRALYAVDGYVGMDKWIDW